MEAARSTDRVAFRQHPTGDHGESWRSVKGKRVVLQSTPGQAGGYGTDEPPDSGESGYGAGTVARTEARIAVVDMLGMLPVTATRPP